MITTRLARLGVLLALLASTLVFASPASATQSWVAQDYPDCSLVISKVGAKPAYVTLTITNKSSVNRCRYFSEMRCNFVSNNAFAGRVGTGFRFLPPKDPGTASRVRVQQHYCFDNPAEYVDYVDNYGILSQPVP